MAADIKRLAMGRSEMQSLSSIWTSKDISVNNYRNQTAEGIGWSGQ